MRRLLIASILLLMAGTAFADAGTLTGINNFASTLTPPASDYSMAYLGQIFGTVGNVVQGTSGQILGKLFDIFNKGLLVVAALWLGYTVLSMSLHGAHEGSFMGQNRNVALTLLRIAFGFVLMVPSSTTGYSLLQDIFMKVVVEGVGLADQIWDTGLDYIKYGGALYIPPSSISTATDIVPSAIGSNSTPGFITQIFEDEVCMIQSNTWQQGTNNSQSQPQTVSSILPSVGGGSSYVNFQPTYEPPTVSGNGPSGIGSGLILFPGVSNATSGCGYVSAYSAASTTLSGLSQNQQINAANISYQALKQAVISLMPAAQAYVDTVINGGTSNTTDIPKTIFTAMLAYTNLITPYQNILSDTVGTKASCPIPTSGLAMMVSSQACQNEWAISEAKKEGWIMAGGFYWTVEQMNNASQTISIANLVPTTAMMAVPAPNNSTYQTTLTQAVTAMTDTTTGYIVTLTTLWDQYVGVQQNSSSTTGGGTGSGLAGKMSSAMNDQLSGIFDLGSTAYNPITVLMNEGNRILTAVVATWIAVILISVVAAGFAGICASTSPGFVVLKAALTWVKSIVMGLTTALMLPGAILAYYVPMYPFVIFTFAAIGWIAMVVEGMAAAPLVCVGLTHPEGHDFLGKAEQALMLFLGIFLRPGLMIIGLIASMVVSFVAFGMLEQGFGRVLTSLSSSGALGNGFLILVNLIMVLLIFGFVTMEVIEQCYKLIYQLPNNIMTWIGAPVTGQDFGQSAKGLQSAVGGAGSSMGSAMGNASGPSTSLQGAQKQKDDGGGKPDESQIQTPGSTGGTPPPGPVA